ncbi:alpha-ketoacid dehydrogenase subunit beta, partial [bacterium]|nr:alpha-ketoacid dehydrogenase subunit beta [bacterium]
MTFVLEALNDALLNALRADPRVVLLGEDILDPYGGAFKVTRGCSTAYPDRVIPAPISEAGLAGVVTGMALRGLRPVLEIMFGDFTTLMADQFINHMSKFRWMYNESVDLPLVIRTPMGGRRGYGPTHSQSLEKLYLGVPGLTVVAPASIAILPTGGDGPGKLLERTILETDSPVLFIENKLQYLQAVSQAEDLREFDLMVSFNADDAAKRYPDYRLAVKGAPQAEVTMAAYGAMADFARQAMLTLAYEHEIFTDLVISTRLAPFYTDTLLK